MVSVSDSTSLHDRDTVTPPAPVSFEDGQVRELEPPAALVTEPLPSRPGVAVAAPVSIEWPSDLQQVESDPQKVVSNQGETEQDLPIPRPKRVRQTVQPSDEGPLVQIETEAATAAPSNSGDKTPAAPR